MQLTPASGTVAHTERELRQHHARHKIVERRRIVQKLRQALSADGLALHFQPILSLSTGLIQGAEAMLRLSHARRGFIQASHFLPLAEQSDVIIEVGGWMLRAACHEAARLPAHFRIALAISPRHLQSGQLTRELLEALNDSGVAPERLELLITEAMLLDENEDSAFALKATQALGVHLGLNHFGTGYASLAPLKRMAFSSLRLDKSLVQNLCEGAASTAITRAAVEAGHALGCSVLADGVETAAQYDLLCQIGTDEGQGSHFTPAIPGDQLTAMFGQG
ncbi:EAL domain-containing protein [Acidocella sp.]|uniref:EAL domain-containing protein n=1 Tax=Acidocella sp. TaxID=50710 RepID=UPI003D036DD4